MSACTVSCTRLAVTGNLDLASVPATAAVLDAVLPSRPRRLLIDLTQCRFIDGAGIGVLLRTHYRMRRTAGRLTLLNPTFAVRRILNVSGADMVLDVRNLRPVGRLMQARPVAAAPSRHT